MRILDDIFEYFLTERRKNIRLQAVIIDSYLIIY